MSYETISVRMNRSDTTIRWGFNFGYSGRDVVISSVEKDSLSEKAGLRVGDIVVTACGRQVSDVNNANQTVSAHPLEVFFSLKRFVTSHTCLPWTLTEKDNKLVVDEVRPGFGSGFGHTAPRSTLPASGFSNNANYNTSSNFNSSSNYNTSSSFSQQQQQHLGSSHGSQFGHTVSSQHSPSARSIPVQLSPASQGTFTSQQRESSSWINQPPRAFNSPSSFASSMKNASYMRDHQSSKMNGAPPQSYSAPDHPAAQNYTYNNGATTTPYSHGSGGVPLNQATFIQTAPAGSLGTGAAGYSPGGSKIFYHSPSPRTKAQVSPDATIQHLQYNSPMNLYSMESAAEQFSQQTGKPMTMRQSTTTPPYLTSETKKLIEENELGRLRRGPSPSAQSSSFKRISQAVGAPVD